MKFKITTIIIFLLFMAILPISITSFNNTDNKSLAVNKTDQNKEITYIVSSLHKEHYSKETIKAIAIICKNNYNISPKKRNTNTASYDNFDYILKIVESISEYNFTYEDNNVYIPYSNVSNGTTFTDKKYSYIKSVASPWDVYNKNYDNKAKCVGVSLEGLNYLCQKGSSAEDALQWYLPGFVITK